jgi:hypothetical protein|tara:strand:- start:77 stop:541 length:465 start_codon:yes stop_codon:yes gene_type:complete
MKNKIFYKLILFIFLLSCGYSKILTQKEYLFEIKYVEKIGNKKINSFIEKQLNSYKSEKNSKKISFNIILNSNLAKKTISKDSKGDPSIFELQITTDVKIINNIDNSTVEREINKKLTYNNLTDKFELSRYENTLIQNLSLNIGNKIISILSNL